MSIKAILNQAKALSKALAWSRIWKRAAKKAQERYHLCHDSYMRLCGIFDKTKVGCKEAEALAASRLELLERAHIALKAHNPWSDLVRELAEELGDVS